MTVGSAIQSAILRCIGTRPQEVFASSQQECVLMADIVQEAASDIAKSADWRALTKIVTLNTAGVQSVPLPDDYDRMVVGSQVDDPGTWFWGYEPFPDVNTFMRYKTGSYQILSPGGWIILGGEMQFWPAPSGQATFPYISNLWARSDDGALKKLFEADNDTFVLSERLLTLALVWRYKEATGLEYAEDQTSYDIALQQEMGRDRGSYLVRTPRSTGFGGKIAYTGRAIR